LRGFLNAVLALMVGGAAIVALAPLAVISVELLEDPLVIGATCTISQQQGPTYIRVEAWYRGALPIADVNLSIGLGGRALAWKTQDLLARGKNITLETQLPGPISPREVSIEMSAVLGGLYSARVYVRGCGQ